MSTHRIKPHPLNRNFVWHMPAPAGLSYLSKTQYRAFNDDGFVKLEGVFTPAEVAAVIAFSSLSPHRTGPNLRKGSVRKAYILQYAPDGAYTVRDGVKALQDDPARQFKILQGGK